MERDSDALKAAAAIAVAENQQEILKDLIKKEDLDVRMIEIDGEENLLHLAAKKNQPEMIDLLIKQGIPVDSPTKQFQQTALHIASYNGCNQAAQALLLHMKNSDIRNFYRETPLRLAIRRGHYEIATRLFAAGAQYENDIIQREPNGDMKLLPSMFLEAAINSHTQIIQLLLTKNLAHEFDIQTTHYILLTLLTNTTHTEVASYNRKEYENIFDEIQRFLHLQLVNAQERSYAIDAPTIPSRTIASNNTSNSRLFFSKQIRK